jgi:hypothetical protein
MPGYVLEARRRFAKSFLTRLLSGKELDDAWLQHRNFLQRYIVVKHKGNFP